MRSRKWTRILVAAMIASTLAGMVVNLSRLTTGRTRPRASPEVAQGFYGPWHEGKILIGNSKFNSFPSGHTATGFGFAWAMLIGSPLAGIPALMIAALIAWASIQLGAHHLSDVVVSILVSGIVALLVWRWMNRHGDATWQRIRNFRKRD
jgi:membrane-associated phospholipid phosphatase